jgi:hypothetical protein
MDIWGNKASRLQRELDQAKEDLAEAREIIKGYSAIAKIVEDTGAIAPAEGSRPAHALLYQQNRRRKPVEQPEALPETE